ncbi:MAG: bifunctional non-ous end joining protein LigD [Candidatus Eremiobacteraeota bacterium]|jgi:DNA primase|nr:bifunctional non-ous end joining protein LigD [Candidatus Eremiobacteraeota bacterium]
MSSHTLYTPKVRAAVLAHYQRAADLIAANFPLAPVEAIEYYPGPGGRAEYTASLHHPVPDSIPTVEVGEFEHTKRYIAIAPNSLLWLVHHNAIGFASWTPSPRDPESVGFGRIILSALHGATVDDLEWAMLLIQSALRDRRLECIPVLGAGITAALFIPFSDAPTYDSVRSWLHDVADTAAASHPLLTTTVDPPAKRAVHVCVATNAVGRISALPYTLEGNTALEMMTPIDWDELGKVRNGAVTAYNSAKRLAKGDVFGWLAKELAGQPFAELRR